MIDLSPYWRPAEFATAIVVADAIAWEGAGVAELKPAMGVDRFGQLPVRAILYRLVADLIADPDSMGARATADAPAISLALRLTGNRE